MDLGLLYSTTCQLIYDPTSPGGSELEANLQGEDLIGLIEWLQVISSLSRFHPSWLLISNNLSERALHANFNREEESDILSIAWTTPSFPYVRLYKKGRPIPTPLAPKHRALMTSVPRRAPPSMYTFCQRGHRGTWKWGLKTIGWLSCLSVEWISKRGSEQRFERWQWQRLTSHFSRISGQFLRISSRVYNAGGAVSSARPLMISACTKQVMISHLARISRPQGQTTAAKQMWKEIIKTCGEKKDSPVIT